MTHCKKKDNVEMYTNSIAVALSQLCLLHSILRSCISPSHAPTIGLRVGVTNFITELSFIIISTITLTLRVGMDMDILQGDFAAINEVCGYPFLSGRAGLGTDAYVNHAGKVQLGTLRSHSHVRRNARASFFVHTITQSAPSVYRRQGEIGDP